jgi:hypothetical protein
MQPVSYLAEGAGVVWHPDGERVLLSEGALPQFSLRQSAFKGQGVAQALGERLGLRLHVLRRLSFTPVAAEPLRHARYLFELEWLAGDLEQHQFVDPRDLLGTLDEPLLESLLREAPAARPAWQRRGWRAETDAWLEAALAARGLGLAGEPELLHNWQISVLYALPLAGGERAYLKSVPPFFAREVPLTAWLHDVYPEATPPVLAADESGSRLLLAHAGEMPGGDLAAAARMLRQLAALQRATAGRDDEMLALGCLDRRLPALVEHARAVIADDDVLLVGEPDGLTVAEVAELRALAPAFWDACARLDEFRLPATLVHGDLHMGNVVERDGQPVILDWSDGAIGHPFIDAHPAYLVEHGRKLSHEEWEGLRDAYLEGWSDLLPLERLREAFALAQPLAQLHLAVGNARYIIPAIEDRSEFADAAPHHLRNAMRLAREWLPALQASS